MKIICHIFLFGVLLGSLPMVVQAQNQGTLAPTEALAKADSLLEHSQILEAQMQYEALLNQSRALNQKNIELQALYGLGRTHYAQNQLESALSYWQEVHILAERAGDTDYISKSFYSLATVFINKKELERARELLHASYHVYKEPNPKAEASAYVTLGRTFIEENEPDSAVYYLNKAVPITLEHNLLRIRGRAYGNLGDLNAREGNIEAAIGFFDQSAECFRLDGDRTYELTTELLKGSLLSKTDRYEEGLALLESGIAELRELRITSDLQYYYPMWINALKANNLKDRAMEVYEDYIAYLGEEYDRDKNARLDDLRAKFEFDLQQSTIETSRATISRQTQWLWIVGTITSIALVLLLLVFRANRQKRRANNKLRVLMVEVQSQNDQLATQAEELRQSNEEVKSLNENLESIVALRTSTIKAQHERLIRYGFLNAHELRGPLARILGLTNLMRFSHTPEEVLDLAEKIEHESKSMDRVVSQINRTIEEEEQLADLPPVPKA